MGYNNIAGNALHRSIMPITDSGDMVKINLFLDSPLSMAETKNTLDGIWEYGDMATKKAITSLYAMFASLIQNNLYTDKEGLFAANMK